MRTHIHGVRYSLPSETDDIDRKIMVKIIGDVLERCTKLFTTPYNSPILL